MKKYLITIIGFIISSSLNAQIKPAENGIDHSKNGISKQQSELIFKNIKSFPNDTELAIAIIKNGTVKFIGVKRTNDTISFNENHQNIFEIGSISKVFTSSLLANFVIDQKLNLEDNIQDYLDFEIGVEDTITFRELANHTSGLPRLPSNLDLQAIDLNNPYKDYNKKNLREYLTGKIKLNEKPGTKYRYSNLGAGILGFELASISDSSYEQLLQERIFKKYGMSKSTSQRENIESTIVKGLKPNGEIASNWDFDVLAGGGAISSTVEDLSKFALAQFNENNAELILTQQPTFNVNKNMSIGLGWHILKNKSDAPLIWHNGGTGGYTSSMALDLNKQNGIIILSNVSAFNKKMGNIDKLCFGLINTL